MLGRRLYCRLPLLSFLTMGKFRAMAIQYITEKLSDDGRKVIDACINEITYTHRTYNLYDSYGWCVYYDGYIKNMGFLSPYQRATDFKYWGNGDNKRPIFGRNEIKRFFDEYKATKDTFELVIAAAMPYAEILEEGGGRLKHKYRVISMSFQKLQELSAKYGGAYVVGLSKGRKI